MADIKLPRREFFEGAGVGEAGVARWPRAASAACSPQQSANASARTRPTRQVLTPEEDAFFSAAADTIIPADKLSALGHRSAACVTFIDRQLASAWGGGAKMYRAGPFVKGTPEQGYQLPLTPHRVLRRRHQCRQ